MASAVDVDAEWEALDSEKDAEEEAARRRPDAAPRAHGGPADDEEALLQYSTESESEDEGGFKEAVDTQAGSESEDDDFTVQEATNLGEV